MRLLKTVLLSTTLLMGATYGALPAIDAEQSAQVQAAAGVFKASLTKIEAEFEGYFTLVKKITLKVHPQEIEVTESGEFNGTIAALSKGVNALIRTNTTLETDLATARGDVERLNAEHARILAEVIAKSARENDKADRFLDDDEHAVPAQPAGGFVTLEVHKALLEELEELRAENKQLKAAPSQAVARSLDYDGGSNAANELKTYEGVNPALGSHQGGSRTGGSDNLDQRARGTHLQEISSVDASPEKGIPHYIDGVLGSNSPVSRQRNKPGDSSSRPDSHTTTPNAKPAGDDVATTPVVARPSARPAAPAADETAVDPNAAEIARLQREIEVHNKLLTLPHSVGGHTERTSGDGEEPQTHSTSKQRPAAINAIKRLKAELAALTNATN